MPTWESWRKGGWIPPFLAGLGIAAVFSVVLFLHPGFVRALQLTASDMLFLREGGPLLGAQSAHPDIVLLLWDLKSGVELGGEADSKVEEDLQLYTVLLEQGARVVADTRVLFEDSPGVKLLLDGMVATGAGGRLLRDIRAASASWFAEQKEPYLAHTAHNLFSFDAGYDVTQYLRYYPLLGFESEEGFYETMALKVARAVLQASPATEVAALARDSGIAAAWVAQVGLPAEALPESLRQAKKEPGRYPLSPDLAIPWVLQPSRDSPMTISPAALWINYGAPPGSFPSFSYVDAMKGRLPAEAFRDKVVVLGVETVDTYPVPTSTSRRSTAAAVVAHAVQTLMTGQFLEDMGTSLAIAGVLVLGLAGAMVFGLMRPVWGGVALVGLLALYLAYATWLYRAGIFPDLVVAPGALLLSALLVGGYRYGREEIARRRLYDLFGRYVPRAVVAELLQKPTQEALALGGVRREITVLFADIRGFTAFSEPLPPEQVLTRLNVLLQLMVECAFRYEGTVDKYIGDAIMVLFNAPLSQTDHVARAVRAAIDMQRAMAGAEGGLAFGIGIYTGEAVVGNVGTKERIEYTAIGNTVNLAARLCDTATRGEIIVSEEVYSTVKGFVEAEPRPPIRVKGIDRELVTYRVKGLVD